MNETYTGELSPDQNFEMLQVHFSDGRWSTKLRHTPEVEDAYRNCLSSECDHDVEPVLRRKPIKAGKPQLVRVCPDCGLKVEGPLAHSTVDDFDNVPWLGELSRDTYEKIRRETWRDRKIIFWDAQDSKVSEEYEAYLKSPKWREKREQVLRRANELCEGCRTAKATEVHHLSYDHRFDEFLWELVAICKSCHDRAHPEKEGRRIGDD